MPGYFRFRRRLKIAPGVHLNVSKSGLSTSFGPRGLHYTTGHGQRRATVGLPGTGLSYTSYFSARSRLPARRAGTAPPPPERAAASARAEPAGGRPGLWSMLPPQKIAYGLLLTLAVITAPVGLPLLVTGLYQLTRPEWRVRTYVAQAAKEPENAKALLETAYSIDPHNPEILGPLAQWHQSTGDPAGAVTLYREYLALVRDDWPARGHLAAACLAVGLVDEAIANLQAIAAGATPTDDSHASLVAHLAYAFLCKEDLAESQAQLNTVSLPHSGGLRPGQQQCLYYRAVTRYLSGKAADAVALIDRLYAVNPTYPDVIWARQSMRDGSFHLLLPDGEALLPAISAGAAASPVIRTRVAPLRCANCGGPAPPGTAECGFCHQVLAPATA